MSAETRAVRLGVSILMRGLVLEQRLAREAMKDVHDARLIDRDEWDEWCDGDDEDINLAVSCLQAEYELRQAQWTALEFLGLVRAGGIRPAEAPADSTSTPPGGACSTADLVTVPRAVAERMACYVLGWPEEA